jgi:Rps23 Pro-64 3,4-dihydroxylase Tpa1-like proline 4-hydroxylase
MQCKLCDKKFESIDSLRKHYGRVHKIPSQQFYDEFVLKGEIPKCKCGCGETPKFIRFEKGYNEWIRGHIARVKNNWGHNQTAIDNSSKTRREQFNNGERTVWNAGLTKEDDLRIAEYGKKGGTSINSNPDEINRRKQYIRTQWEAGIFRVKWGKEAANWKGGTSSINNLVRANKRLYREWKYPILKEQKFKCQTCSSSKNLEVHHNKETMSEILQKFVDKNKEYTFDEKRKIMNDVIYYHIHNSVSGEVLCRECHKELHPSYNY